MLSGAAGAQLDAIRRGAAQVIFSTHALAREGLPEFRKLSLVIVEERDAFGAVSRAALMQKNNQPDLLVTTSVPIPTSLVVTVFNDYDLSIIDRPAVQHVETVAGEQSVRQEVFTRIQGLIDAGRQAYMVFPMVNGHDLITLEKAHQLANSLATEAFPGCRVAAYHGAMTREERFRIFEDFQHRRIDILMSTTVIEDAPGVANATAMIIEYADRFDLVRLHRLRGHVSQGHFPGFCGMLLSREPSEEGSRLVELVAREQDGFTIAEEDRLVRGDRDEAADTAAGGA